MWMLPRKDEISSIMLLNYKVARGFRWVFRKLWYLMGPLFFIGLILHPNWNTAIQIVISIGALLVLELGLAFWCWLCLSFIDKDQRPKA